MQGRRLLAILVCVAVLIPARLIAQGSNSTSSTRIDMKERHTLESVLGDEEVQQALQHIDTNKLKTADFLAHLAAIPSPSGNEGERAKAVERKMQEIGLKNVTIDPKIFNVLGVIPGQPKAGQARPKRALVIVSTLDDLKATVEAQNQAKVRPQVEGDQVKGPGTDHASSIASMLAVAEALVARPDVQLGHDVVFAAVAGEESGLTGMKALYADYKDRSFAFIDILGDGGLAIWYGASGKRLWKNIVAKGPGGHTLDGGLPNVNQAIGRAVDQILTMQQTKPKQLSDPSLKINIAKLQSGKDENHKPEEGSFSLDIRSMNDVVIDRVEKDVHSVLDQVAKDTSDGDNRIYFKMGEPSQIDQAAQIPWEEVSALAESSKAVAEHLGLNEFKFNGLGSGNFKIALAGGSPAIGIYGERGDKDKVGKPDEFADIPALIRTAKHVLLLTVMPWDDSANRLTLAPLPLHSR